MSMQRKKYCQIKSCVNNRGTFDRTFRVPRCDPSIRNKWVQAIKNHDPGFQEHTAQFVNVCLMHFDTDDVYESGKNRVLKLRPGAFPKNFVDPLEGEKRSNEMVKTEQLISAQIPENSVRLVKIVIKKDTNVSKEAKKVATCIGCLNSEAEMQAMRQKIADVDHELAQQRNEINYLKKSIKFISKPRLQHGLCELCQKRLPTDELDTHFCINNGQTSIQCGYCSLTFVSTFKLLEHLKVFHDDKTFVECNECNGKFEMEALLDVHKTIHQIQSIGVDDLRHLKKDHSSDGYQCGSCGQIYQTARILRSHKKRHHLNVEQKEKLFECYVCKEPLASLSQVRYHLAKCHRSSMRCTLCKCSLDNYQINHHLCRSGNFIKCDYCPRTFLSVIGILKHLEGDHEHTKTVHQCNACNKYYYMKLLLDYHSIFHETNEKSHICYICGKSYFEAVHLSVHIRNVHTKEKSFLCVHCGSAFKRRYDLKVHLESHADKTLQCPDCPMVFRHLRALNSHKEQHSNINYVCGTCNVELKTKFAFRDHMRKHNGQTDKKKHECSFCARKFAFRNDLIAHTRKHTGEKPIECQYCNSKFRYKTSLKLHLRTHFGDKIYFCTKQDCDERFQFARELQDHLAEHYKSEMEALNMDSFTVDI